MSVIVTKEDFLNDLDEILVYIDAYVRGAEVNIKELFPVMGAYIKEFGNVLREKSICELGEWISHAATYNLSITCTEYYPERKVIYKFDSFTKEPILTWLVPILIEFNNYWNEEGMSLEEAISSIYANKYMRGNMVELEKIAKYTLKEQIDFLMNRDDWKSDENVEY